MASLIVPYPAGPCRGACEPVRPWHAVNRHSLLAEITALGGGVLRDVLIGAVPPAA